MPIVISKHDMPEIALPRSALARKFHDLHKNEAAAQLNKLIMFSFLKLRQVNTFTKSGN
jgi:hypothetical protein